MTATAGMFEARLELVERIRKVEHALAHAEQARIAAALMRGRSHDLGNAVQIVKLSALELQRRIAAMQTGRTDLAELITDMNTAADQASRVLAEMIDAARASERTDRVAIGPVVSHGVRAAIEAARPALMTTLDLRIDLDDTVHTYLTPDELEALVLAAALDTASSAHVTFSLRERVIQSRRWVELLRIDDRQVHDGEYAHMFEECSLLRLVSACAKAGGGEASLSAGRSGLELAIELPVARLPQAVA